MADTYSIPPRCLSEATDLSQFVRKNYVDMQAQGLLNKNQFGDVLDSFPRVLAAGSVAMTTGVVYATGLFAPFGGTATKVRLATTADALSGSGTYQVGIYAGTTPAAALTQRATITAQAFAINSAFELALSAAVTWAAGDYVAMLALPLTYTTPPRLRSIVGGGVGTAVLNSGNRLCATSAAGQTGLPASPNISSYSGSGSPHWWALAA